MQHWLNGFIDELEKRATLLGSHKMDLAGLGVLGLPAAYHLATGKDPNKKAAAAAEVGGLGILAGSVLKAAKHL